MKVLKLSGSPRDMGRAFGEAYREEIATFYQLRIANAIRQALKYGGRHVDAEEVMEAARGCVEPTRKFDPVAFEELEGIAEGANMPLEQILATNGLTDIRDIVSWPGDLKAFGGCTAFVVQRDSARDGSLLCGQTWDLATDNLPYVLGVHRKPNNGPETRCLTTVGCLSLIGMNEHGISIGTTNVRTKDSRHGVTYLSIIHKVLAQDNLDDAIKVVTEAQRAGAHFYYIASPDGRAVSLECSAKTVTRQDINNGVFAHTNHCLETPNQNIEGHLPQSSSLARLERMTALLSQEPNSRETLIKALGDRENGDDAINRDDINGINTNGAVIMSPEDRKLWACKGLPDLAEWISF